MSNDSEKQVVDQSIKKIDELYKTHPHANTGLRFDEERLNILSLQVDDGGCGWYRVRQYIEEFNRQGLANTYILKPSDKEELIAEAIGKADIIIARNGNSPMIEAIQGMYPGKVIVFDHDDNTFKIDWTNEHYKDHGVDDTKLWVTGVTPGFDKFKNRRKRHEMVYMLETSALNTSPVENLSDLWAQFNGRGAVVENGINFEMYPELEIKDPKKGQEFRIGWQGGVSHLADIGSVAKQLEAFLREKHNAFYYSVGSYYEKLMDGVTKKVRKYEWLPFKAHPYRMATLGLDVAIIPLDDSEFNDYKSEIKFSEFAALKIPCLVRNRLPYSRVCKNEENCLTYDTPEEFKTQLERLYEDKELGNRLAKNAYKWVKENRDMKKLAKDAIKMYKDLLNEVQ
jgi:glycosyltransferase involved in cell wall biosynthesis